MRALEERITTFSRKVKKGAHNLTYWALANIVPVDSIPKP